MTDAAQPFDGQSTSISSISSGGGGLRRRRIDSENKNDDDGGGAAGSSSSSSPSPKLEQSSLEQSPSSLLSYKQQHERQQQQQQQQQPPSHEQQKSVVPLAMHLMRPFWHMSCGPDCLPPTSNYGSFEDEFFAGTNNNSINQNNNPFTPPRRNISMASSMNKQLASSESDAAAAVGRIGNGIDSNVEVKAEDGIATPTRVTATKSSPANDYLNHSPVSSVSSNNNSNHVPPTPLTPPQRRTATATTTATLSSYANTNNNVVSIEQILHEYTTACAIFGCSTRINPGVLTTLRFSLPTLRVSGNFFDADMLAVTEVLLKHCNGALRYIRRLDFTIAGKEGKDRGGGFNGGGGGGSGKKGVRSHGAYALSKVLCVSDYIEEVYLNRNRIGPYGSSAIFNAASENRARGGRLRTLLMRGCRVGERGGLAFAELMRATTGGGGSGSGNGNGLREVDLSANRIGFQGCFAIEEALKDRMEGRQEGQKVEVLVDLEGNMVFQEVMNCITHGLGILLGTLGTKLLHGQIEGMPRHYHISCAIYSASIIVLYTSSTLFHSFFALKKTKFIFQVFDRCAIYLLIAGSYTPFLMIALHHEPMWSLHLLLFIWVCAISGIVVEALFRTWKHKALFSLAMYLGMGWSCMVCVPDMIEVLPMEACWMVVAGGVAYTGGVPFFVRNTNMDHSIWHMFVLAGSLFHWLCVYWYVAIPKEVQDGS